MQCFQQWFLQWIASIFDRLWRLQCSREESGDSDSQGGFIALPEMICSLNNFVLFRLRESLAEFEELVGGYEVVLASRNEKFRLSVISETIKVKHGERE